MRTLLTTAGLLVALAILAGLAQLDDIKQRRHELDVEMDWQQQQDRK